MAVTCTNSNTDRICVSVGDAFECVADDNVIVFETAS